MEEFLLYKKRFYKRISSFENGVVKESASFKGSPFWEENCYLEKKIQI